MNQRKSEINVRQREESTKKARRFFQIVVEVVFVIAFNGFSEVTNRKFESI